MSADTMPATDFSLLLTEQSEFSVCVKSAKGSEPTHAPRVDLLFLRFKEDIPDVNGLAEIVCNQVVNYALPKKKIKEIFEKTDTSKLDLSAYSKLIAEAKRAFIAYDSQATGTRANVRYAEVGEAIAFCIASHFLKAGQVAPKMALKTNSEMPVYGLDGIHVRTEDDGTITAYFLESKVVANAKSGGKQYAESAAGFDKDRNHKLNEQRIARDLSNFDIFEAAARQTVLEYFDPYSEAQSNVRERFVGVIVYTEPLYTDKLAINDATPLDAHEKHFVAGYSALHATCVADLTAALKKAGAEPGRCRAFFLAVPDSAQIKELFAEQMSHGHIR